MRTASIGRTRISGGTVRSEPVVTSAGSVFVESRGVIIESPWGGFRWLRPARVEALYPDGRSEGAAVRDVTRRVLLALLAAGLIVAWLGAVIQGSRRRAK